MKSIIRACAAGIAMLAIVAATSGRAAAEPVVLVQDGKARVAIHVAADVMAEDRQPPADARGATAETQRRRLRESVRDLSTYLERMGKAAVPVRIGPPAESDATIPILVGQLADVRFKPMSATSEFRQGYRVVVSPKGIGLQGETDEATSYAIFELLDELGCRWYLPGVLGEVVPQKPKIELAERDASLVPRTGMRNVWYADDAFRRRNRLGGFAYTAGHALEGYITKEQLEKHPEWNAEFDGKRVLHRCDVGHRLCWANPEVSDAVAEALIATLDKSPGTPCISVSPGDGTDFCECAKCRALDTGDWDASLNTVSITDRYIHFCNRVAERVAKKHPQVKLGFLAYVQFTRPPLREKLHPLLIPQLAPISYCRAHAADDVKCASRESLQGILKGWGRASRNIAMYEYGYHLAEVAAPFPMIARNVVELPLQYSNGVTMWTPETLPTFESGLPGLWLGIRMSWKAGSDPKAILDEFYPGFYGAAAGPMRDYWEAVDAAWTNSPEHAGCCFGYMRRFTPERLADLRRRMDTALAACQTAPEFRRVTLADQSLRQLERFMAMRRDYFEGRFQNLERDAQRWIGIHQALAREYADNYAFAQTYWAQPTVGVVHAKQFAFQSYNDAARLTRECELLTPPLNTWRYAVDKDKKGESRGWQNADCNDGTWEKTDLATDTWGTLGLSDYYGTVWYRRTVDLPTIAEGKKVFLWIGGTDGRCKVFVNGRHVPFAGADGKVQPEADGYCQPFSFDITSAVRSGGANTIAIVGTRTGQNELGTGGLLGPAVIGLKK